MRAKTEMDEIMGGVSQLQAAWTAIYIPTYIAIQPTELSAPASSMPIEGGRFIVWKK